MVFVDAEYDDVPIELIWLKQSTMLMVKSKSRVVLYVIYIIITHHRHSSSFAYVVCVDSAYDMRKPFKKTLEKRKAEAEAKEKETKEGPKTVRSLIAYHALHTAVHPALQFMMSSLQ
jgi:hypothetical protein